MLYYNFLFKAKSCIFRKRKIFALTLNKVFSIPFFRVEKSLLAFDEVIELGALGESF
jgi:hypothetical protein